MRDIEKAVKSKQDGAFLNLFVIPNSSSNFFPAGYNEWRKTVEIKVCSPAKDNKANIEVIKTVAEFFNVPINNVLIVSGGKNKEKTVLIKHIPKKDVLKKLMESLNGL